MYTKITDITWATPEDQFANGEPTFNDERINYIQIKVNENKTDGVGYQLSNVETRRLWLDQTTAQEYIDFITSLATTYNCTITQTQILDNAQ